VIPILPFSLGENINEQMEKSIQIINNTNEDYLHVFIFFDDITFGNILKYYDKKLNTKIFPFENFWTKRAGEATIGRIIGWGKTDSIRQPMIDNGIPEWALDSITNNSTAWNPLGSQWASEIIIKKGKYVVLDIPESLQPDTNHYLYDKYEKDKDCLTKVKGCGAVKDQFSVMGIKLNDNKKNTIFDIGEDVVNSFSDQPYATKIEAGIDAVSDLSAVDGVNFNIVYELSKGKTDSIKSELGKNLKLQIIGNPCKELDDKFKYKDSQGSPMDGCVSPFHICSDCPYKSKNDPRCKNPTTKEWEWLGETTRFKSKETNKDSGNCVSGTQDCGFNMCSFELFKEPSNNNDITPSFSGQDNIKYKNNLQNNWNSNTNGENITDGGKKGLTEISPDYMPVKRYLNRVDNLKHGDLYKYCKGIQEEGGNNPVPYCYDYNDLDSSPTLLPPYKIKLTFQVLNDN